MTFPDTPLGVTVELLIGGVWTDVTGLTFTRDPIGITRGRSAEEVADGQPSTCRLTANNIDGNLSPRNPTGIYYGLIGRNTRMRVRVDPASPGYLLTPPKGKATTPSSFFNQLTGSIDIRIDVAADLLPLGGDGVGLASKYETASGNQRSWAFWVDAAGRLNLAWSPDGTLAARITQTSTASITPPASGRVALRVALDTDSGGGASTVTFYTAPTIDGVWTQLGAPVVGTQTSLFGSTAPVIVGGIAQLAGVADAPTGRVYAFQLRDTSTGTLIHDLRFDDAEAGATSLVSATGETWTVSGDASIVTPAIRFAGEISEWPQRWARSGRDVYVPLEASGILRRLIQGASPLQSTLYRGYTTLGDPPKAYWPCEDAEGSTTLASALGGKPMTVSGTPTLASSTAFKASLPLPVMNASQWVGLVPSYTATGELQVWMLISIPEAGTTDNQSLFSVHTTGTVRVWSLRYGTGGLLALRGFDASGAQVADSGFIDFNLNGAPERISVALTQDGADIDYEILGQRLDGQVGGLGGTFAGLTFGRATAVVVNPGADNLGDIVFGHVSVHDQIRNLFDLIDEFIAYVGEPAGRRIQRLCGEEGVAFRGVGDLDATTPMGAQLPAELLTLLTDAANADGGILHEPRDLFGLAYRTRESLYNQTAGLALDYGSAHLSGIDPVDDDQATRNDITVQRAGGSTARAVQDSGLLSVQPPPDGVGRYDDKATLNLEADSQLPDAAGWLLHLGTVDEARYPVLAVNRGNPVIVADPTLSMAILDLDMGGRLTVSNPPPWLPPDDITQLARGFAEQLQQFAHSISVNCSPESPWSQAGRYDDGESRYSSDGSTLAEDLTTTETGVDVATPAGPLWSHADGDFEIVVGGEVMTVTAISGTSSPQTFTVVRSVNNVVKTHSTGAEVALAHPVVYVR